MSPQSQFGIVLAQIASKVSALRTRAEDGIRAERRGEGTNAEVQLAALNKVNDELGRLLG